MSQPPKIKAPNERRQLNAAKVLFAYITGLHRSERRPAKILVVCLLCASAVLLLTLVRQFFASTRVAYA